jgi:hypothetical protein
MVLSLVNSPLKSPFIMLLEMERHLHGLLAARDVAQECGPNCLLMAWIAFEIKTKTRAVKRMLAVPVGHAVCCVILASSWIAPPAGVGGELN